MNFKMKAAVAALALTASMSASAALETNASGNSSLVLTLLDTASNISATFDLGLNYSTFAESIVTAGPDLTWNLSGNANYASAWSTFASTANLATAKWAVFAGDNNGAGAGNKGMIVTYTTLPATLQTTTELGNQLNSFDLHITAVNGLGIADNGAVTATPGTNAYAGSTGAYNGDGKVNLKGAVTWGSFNQSLGVVSLVSGANASARVVANPYGNSIGASKFTMSNNGQLVFTAPVPEADTWAMLLAGLGLMGFIARRRTAA